MSRGPLRGADELFRATALAVPHDPGGGQGGLAGFEGPAPSPGNKNAGCTAPEGPEAPAAKATSGRTRHDGKVTAYLAEHGEASTLVRRLAGA